jgi:hypothetical protein
VKGKKMKKSTLTYTAMAAKGISFVAYMAALLELPSWTSAASLSLMQTALAWLAVPVGLCIVLAGIDTAAMIVGWKAEEKGAA